MPTFPSAPSLRPHLARVALARAALALAALAVAALGTPRPAAAEDTVPAVVRIATEGAYAPYNFTKPDGSLDGYEIELAREICKRAKLTCEFVVQDWDGVVPGLQAKKFDAIMSGMTITEARQKVIDFTRPYSGDFSGLAVDADGPLAKLPLGDQKLSLATDEAQAQKAIDAIKPLLKGKTIGAQVSTIHANFLDKYLKGTVEIREYKTTEQHDLDLAAGRIDGILANDAVLRATAEKPEFKGSIVLAGPRFRGGILGRGVAMGLRKGEAALKARLDEGIGAVIADGTLKTLSIKWFKVDMTPSE
ncbi:extracellular solute-binding protein family 3 [Methylobacterium sp. 4-46]|uniref:transporter substrate-binding domain-containing protein n=1 Tax=unclassified Methylobacterium TaxID=2615210 RepID=UPI000152DFA8|nr:MULTISPECIES: transporter substrate-binding domain-containing protein [Methylobacterium]ACA18826.1 extracellular solute-binding protein family 3 [Methylobacterium sp. 4-46]WFT78052.1 transporter substrate-binding domain-containing protein [Methylobacterium nodulans]